MVHVLADDVESHLLPELAKMSSAAGLITICTIASDEQSERDRARDLSEPNSSSTSIRKLCRPRTSEATDQIARLLEARGFVRPDERGIGGDGI